MTPSSAPPVPLAAADPGLDPIAAFHQRADALFRSACECCRQHERLAHLVQIGALPLEQRAAQSQVHLCDEALGELAAAYEKASGRAHPSKDDACWQAANALWLASREYARRQHTSERAKRGISDDGDHSSARLTELALDYDLEASALLLLKQATERYRKARPEVR